jgi:hypothetical protein
MQYMYGSIWSKDEQLVSYIPIFTIYYNFFKKQLRKSLQYKNSVQKGCSNTAPLKSLTYVKWSPTTTCNFLNSS